jgi:hypothetical protein
MASNSRNFSASILTSLPAGDHLIPNPLLHQLIVKVMLRLTISQPVYLGPKPHLGHKTRFLLLSDCCLFVDVGHPLLHEGRSAIYNCCWPSITESFSDMSPTGLTIGILPFQIWDSPSLEGQVPIFISPSNRVVQLPQALESLFVASYNSQGYQLTSQSVG